MTEPTSTPVRMSEEQAELKLLYWLEERLANCERFVAKVPAEEIDGWLEDAEYFRAAIKHIRHFRSATKEIEALHSRWNNRLFNSVFQKTKQQVLVILNRRGE